MRGTPIRCFLHISGRFRSRVCTSLRLVIYLSAPIITYIRFYRVVVQELLRYHDVHDFHHAQIEKEVLVVLLKLCCVPITLLILSMNAVLRHKMPLEWSQLCSAILPELAKRSSYNSYFNGACAGVLLFQRGHDYF